MSKRRNPIPKSYIIGAIAAGAGLYLLTRTSSAATYAAEPINTPAVPTPTTLPGLLRTNKTARQIFNVQALAWEMGLSTDVPDARFGPRTQAMVNAAEDAVGDERTIAFTPFSLFSIKHAGERNATNLRLRLLPMYLPTDVVQLLNREALAIDPNAILIQARPMASSSSPTGTSSTSGATTAPPTSTSPPPVDDRRWFNVLVAVSGSGDVSGISAASVNTVVRRTYMNLGGGVVAEWIRNPSVTVDAGSGMVVVYASMRVFATPATKVNVAKTIAERELALLTSNFSRVEWSRLPSLTWT